MTTVSKDGTLYGIIWTNGKPPDDLNLGLMGWTVELRTTSKGRQLTITSLRQLQTTEIFTFELKLSDLMKVSKSAPPYIRDRAMRRTEADRLENLRLVSRRRKAG